MKSDLALDHQALGLLGTFWARQVDADTKAKAGAVATVAGGADSLMKLDVVKSYAANERRTLVRNVELPFVDGDFAVVGTDFEAYTRSVIIENGSQRLLAYRDPAMPGNTTTAYPHKLSRLPIEFSARLATLPLPEGDSTWYLLPIPENLSPILIAGSDPSEVLTSGIDFLVRRGYIAMRTNPGEVFKSGYVRVLLAYQNVPPPNSYSLSANDDRFGNKFIAEYFAKSQSLKSFRMAAAEYCGLFVLPEDDLLMQKHDAGEGRIVYVWANLGAVAIDYPHQPLKLGAIYLKGYIVSGRFTLQTLREHGTGFASEKLRLQVPRVSLDGCLPVKGMSYLPGVSINFVWVAEGQGQLYLEENELGVREQFWEAQRNHELREGVSLADELGLTSENSPMLVDFGALLETFYGQRLAILVFDELPAPMGLRLKQFLAQHSPTGCTLLTAEIPATI